ncbi:MAG TPA: FIST N-terminal domain-containing protein [Ignavibacteria bacterium]|nr:FIST N-terminal domain-containing protein [Ignavibacteria bacterium]
MKIQQLKSGNGTDWELVGSNADSTNPNLVIIFGSTDLLKNNVNVNYLKEKYPNAIFAGCSTSGEISGVQVFDNTIIATAIEFEKTKIISHSIEINSPEDSFSKGAELINMFDSNELKHIFVLSDGLNINGSKLVEGMRSVVPQDVSITGGLAGDGSRFSETFIIDDERNSVSKKVTAVGFYGKDIKIGYGSLGGWDSFGIDRVVTKSKGNVLFELDNTPALTLYKSFLGDQAKNLPSSGLLFPLSMRTDSDTTPVVRTILAIDENAQSLTFAGDIPEGAYVRLMKANFDRLIDGAEEAAKVSVKGSDGNNPELAILISCVGRKLVLKQMVEEEVEAVQSVIGENSIITGFYSYGEIAPFMKEAKCELHNQTMTITTFSEN